MSIHKKLQFKDINEKYPDTTEDSLNESLLPRKSTDLGDKNNVTEEDPLFRANSNDNLMDPDTTTANARVFEAAIDNKEIAIIEDKIEDFFGYVIFVWVLFIVHFINLGYFLFMLFLNYNKTSPSFSITLSCASAWNCLQIVIWWHAFLGREQHNLKRQMIAVYGLILGFGIISIGLVLLCFGFTLMPDILFEAASGLLWVIMKNTTIAFMPYLVAGVVELLIPVYMFISVWKIKDLLEKRKELLENIEKTRSIRE